MNALLIFFYLFSDHPRCCRTPSRTPLNLQSVIKGLHDMLLLVRKCNPSTLIHPFTRLNDEAKIEVLNTSRPVHLAYSFGKFTCFHRSNLSCAQVSLPSSRLGKSSSSEAHNKKSKKARHGRQICRYLCHEIKTKQLRFLDRRAR